MASAASLRDALTRLAETLIRRRQRGGARPCAFSRRLALRRDHRGRRGALLRRPMLVPNGGVTGGDGASISGRPHELPDGDAGAFHVPKPRCLLLMVTAIGARSCLMRGRVRTSAIGAPTATNRTDRTGSNAVR